MESSALVYIVLAVVTVGLALAIENRDYVPARLQKGYAAGEFAPFTRQQARNTVAETAIYLLLAGVSACRIAVGNDYWVYRDNFKLIAQSRLVSSELGFNLIVKGIQDLFGYDRYLPVFGFFSLVTVFFFVKALHDQSEHYAFSLFLLLTGGFYFNSLNSVRYYLVLAIALYAVKYVFRGEVGKFLLWIAVGAFFHKTILFVIPVYLIAWLLAGVRIRKGFVILGGLFTASLVIFKDFYREVIFAIYPYYRNSDFDNGRISYANIAKCAAVLILCIICYRKSLTGDRRMRFYALLNLGGLVVYCCGAFIPEVSRVGFYLIAPQIFLIPRLVGEMENKLLRRLAYVGVIGAFSAYFVLLLRGMYAVDVRLLPYLNWIFN